MRKTVLMTGAVSAALAVVFGALAAHYMKTHLEPAQAASFDTAARYQMYHSLALIALGLLPAAEKSGLYKSAYYLFLLGMIFFSGSIYVLSTRSITGLEVSWLGPVTPLGGLLFISGWLSMAYHVYRSVK